MTSLDCLRSQQNLENEQSYCCFHSKATRNGTISNLGQCTELRCNIQVEHKLSSLLLDNKNKVCSRLLIMLQLLPGRIFELRIDIDNCYSIIDKLMLQKLLVRYQTCLYPWFTCKNKCKYRFIALFYFNWMICTGNKV